MWNKLISGKTRWFSTNVLGLFFFCVAPIAAAILLLILPRSSWDDSRGQRTSRRKRRTKGGTAAVAATAIFCIFPPCLLLFFVQGTLIIFFPGLSAELTSAESSFSLLSLDFVFLAHAWSFSCFQKFCFYFYHLLLYPFFLSPSFFAMYLSIYRINIHFFPCFIQTDRQTRLLLYHTLFYAFLPSSSDREMHFFLFLQQRQIFI